MKQALIIGKQDFLVTFRDPVFKGLLFFPFIAYALVRFLLPVLIETFPVVATFDKVILMWACQQTATMFGFIYGFIFLDEKEEKIDQVLKIIPLPGLLLTGYRLGFGMLFSMLVNFLLLHFGGVIQLPWWQEIMLALLFSLIAPLMALYLGALAKNKIEGMAQIKIINLLLIMPALIYFFPYQLLHFFALVPSYWMYRSLELAPEPVWLIFFLAGLVYSSILLWLMNRKMRNQF